MISPEKATCLVKENLILRAECLAKNIVSDRHYPPFDRVMMDGIAVKFESYQNGLRQFVVAGVAPAGEAAKVLSDEKACLEVMTGAPLPRGADLVIPYEHIEINSGLALVVREVERFRMENVHLKGSDCQAGEVVLNAGEPFNGPHAGIITSMGESPELSKSSRILIISTGDELVDLGTKPLEHQIRRSNVYALKRSLELNGHRDVTLSHLNDDAAKISEHYEAQAEDFDLMIYSGGVSKGKFDYLPHVWSDLGVKKIFHQVAQRPGKPFWFGVDEKRKTVVAGLPGNPVSSLVCLHRYLIPGKAMFARLNEEIVFKKELTYFVPVKIEYCSDGSVWASPMKIKNSGEFTALAGSDGFIELPAQQEVFSKGEAFAFWPWRNA